MSTINIVIIVISITIFLFVVELIRQERLTFKYALGWMLLFAGAAVGAVFEDRLIDLAHIFGFELASNFVFFVAVVFFLFLSMFMTIFLCQQNKNNNVMIQKIAMLEHEILELKRKRDFNSNDKNNNASGE